MLTNKTLAKAAGPPSSAGAAGPPSSARAADPPLSQVTDPVAKAVIAMAIVWAVIITNGANSNVAQAQSIDPMLGKITSSQDFFSVRVKPGNPYEKRMKMFVGVYDHEFKPVKARVTPQNFTVRAKDTRTVLVKIPFGGRKSRRVRICAETYPFGRKTGSMRTRVCGKFLGIKR